MIELDVIGSTNTFLKDYRPFRPIDVTLVTAEFQTAGRGQAGNSWESRHGENLLFSLALSALQVPATEMFVISEAIALAIREAIIPPLAQLEETLDLSRTRGEWEGTPSVTVKWPNDIYVGDSKIAGILIENDLQGSTITRSIIGCGVNINQQRFLFPTLSPTGSDDEKPAPTPISLRQLLGQNTERRFVLDAIMEHFMRHYDALQRGDFCEIHAAYRAALYRGIGLHPFRDADGSFNAAIEGVEPTGHLLLRDTTGRQRRYAFKEVAFLEMKREK